MTEKRTTESSEPLQPPNVCKRPGCTASLTRDDNKTGYCGLHKGDAKRKPDLSEEELKECRADDWWDVHHNETDTVACRICGQRWACLGSHGRTNHLLKDHGRTVAQYRKLCQEQGWGRPAIRSVKSQEAIAKWRDKHPERVKNLGRRRKAKVKHLRATDPDARKHFLDLQRRGTARSLQNLPEAEKARRVPCPVPGCNLPFRSLGRHSKAIHGIPLSVLRHLYPDAPPAPADLDLATKMSELSKGLWAERKQKLAKVADAERVLAEQQPDPRITLAVCLELQGLKKYAMKDQVFADLFYTDKTEQRDARKARTFELFRRHPKEFERERQRVSSLSDSERLFAAERARSQILQAKLPITA